MEIINPARVVAFMLHVPTEFCMMNVHVLLIWFGMILLRDVNITPGLATEAVVVAAMNGAAVNLTAAVRPVA